jgi:hypothetical protein
MTTSQVPICTDAGVRHYADAHFPGLYSIVLSQANGLLRRMFVARPGRLHADLTSATSPFLWHSHGYNLKETSVTGAVTNWIATPSPSGRAFSAYHIAAGITSGVPPRLWPVGAIKMDCTSTLYDTGASFELDSSVIHRVVFHPHPLSNWFACLVEETAIRVAPTVVYSPENLQAVPNAELLYHQASPREAQAVLDDLFEEHPENICHVI